MKILITGANGFIGSKLVKVLKEGGNIVYEHTRKRWEFGQFRST